MGKVEPGNKFYDLQMSVFRPSQYSGFAMETPETIRRRNERLQDGETVTEEWDSADDAEGEE